MKTKIKKSHVLPTYAKLSLNGNLLVHKPGTDASHVNNWVWFDQNGQFISYLEPVEILDEHEDFDGNIHNDYHYEFPDYIDSMYQLMFNTENCINQLIFRFPTQFKRLKTSGRRDVFRRNINGRIIPWMNKKSDNVFKFISIKGEWKRK